MEIKTKEFVDIAKKELKNPQNKKFLSVLPFGVTLSRARSMQSFTDPEAANEYGRAIRSEVIARLPELLEQFEKNAIANGAKIIWARTADEANAFIAEKLGKIKKKSGPESIAGLSSARCTNEENYLFQKFMRAVIGTNHVDHCARL